MGRRLVYNGGLGAFIGVCVLTLTSIFVPRWISWNSTSPSGEKIHYTYGLHRRCSSLAGAECSYFPQTSDCLHDRSFCSLWRSVGFLLSFAVVMEGMTLIAYLVISLGGSRKRQAGWKVLVVLHAIVAILLGAGMSIIAYLYNTDDRFFPGWRLDASWILCTVGFCLTLLATAGIAAAEIWLPSEGGYELIPNYEDDD